MIATRPDSRPGDHERFRYGVRGRCWATALATILSVAVSRPSLAQARVGDSAVDSANAARGAWGRANAALRAGDLLTAGAEASRAATAWPTQPAYLWGRATIAARAADTATALRALTDFAALGLGRDLSADPAIAPLLGVPAFAALSALHDANRKPLVGSIVRAVLPDTTFWAEAADVDPRTGRYYFASVRHRTIAELSPDGSFRDLWRRDARGIGAVLGIRVDTARRVIWATTSGIPQMHGYAPADSGIAALLRIRIEDGTIERRWDIPPTARGHVLGDVAVSATGDVYLTDSSEPVLYRLRSGGDTLERITSPLFRSLQGLAPTPDGRSVYLADYSHGLLRLDLASGVISRLADAPGSTALGCDGIVWHRGSIIAVQNGVVPARIMRFALDASGQRIVSATTLDRQSEIADEPTTGKIVGDHFVYVATSHWEKYREDGTRRPGIALTPAVLLAVPLGF